MALPATLKNFNLFNDGVSYMGKVTEANLPKLTRKFEEYRAAGMNGPISLDLGQEAIEMEWTLGGPMREVLAQYGTTKHDGVMLRFAGAYQAEDTGKVDAVEVVIRGRHKELDFGAQKPGDTSPFKVMTAVSYYKLTINGEDVIEIDIMNMIEKIGGVDVMAEIRRALGM